VYDGNGDKPEWRRIVMKRKIRRKGAETDRVRRKNCHIEMHINCLFERIRFSESVRAVWVL
jgi:hypothetical protein